MCECVPHQPDAVEEIVQSSSNGKEKKPSNRHIQQKQAVGGAVILVRYGTRWRKKRCCAIVNGLEIGAQKEIIFLIMLLLLLLLL